MDSNRQCNPDGLPRLAVAPQPTTLHVPVGPTAPEASGGGAATVSAEAVAAAEQQFQQYDAQLFGAKPASRAAPAGTAAKPRHEGVRWRVHSCMHGPRPAHMLKVSFRHPPFPRTQHARHLSYDAFASDGPVAGAVAVPDRRAGGSGAGREPPRHRRIPTGQFPTGASGAPLATSGSEGSSVSPQYSGFAAAATSLKPAAVTSKDHLRPTAAAGGAAPTHPTAIPDRGMRRVPSAEAGVADASGGGSGGHAGGEMPAASSSSYVSNAGSFRAGMEGGRSLSFRGPSHMSMAASQLSRPVISRSPPSPTPALSWLRGTARCTDL